MYSVYVQGKLRDSLVIYLDDSKTIPLMTGYDMLSKFTY